MKQTTILVGRDGRPSMKVVYAQMKSGTRMHVVRTLRKSGRRYIREYLDHNVDKLTKQPVSVLLYPKQHLIRWGNRVEAGTDGSTITYNKSEAIARATNKKKSREIFMEKGVSCPKLVTPTNVTPNQFPVIARPLVHSKGKNFITLRNVSEFQAHYNSHNGNWYYSEFIDKEREFRVHCAHGKVLAIMEKPRAVGIAWNRAQNHSIFIRVPQNEYRLNVCLEAIKSIEALELDFGGVDVMIKGDNAYVLEVNTAPTLNSSEYVSQRYAQYFDWLTRKDDRRDHWKFTDWKKAKSFSWKNFQLDDIAGANEADAE